ncbi:MAG: S1-like domain-containing RNA-binding protein [Saccharospirillaceae bacterium]|nr:S1-like domain-containing RNA-binding protein [Saccharospirillaceae bacterium]MCD8531085.1 S1-like domain-containing RNA-binding protein [Saccharospirillaceae bacterium]
MAELGLYNTLTVLDEQPHGLYLDDNEGGKILLPRKQIPAGTRIGDSLRVFVYLDSDDRPIATCLRPKAQLHQVAWLEAVDVNTTGAFLDWGLAKDVFVPFAEQTHRMEAGKSYAVYLYLDNTNRIVASARLNRFIKDEVKANWPGAPIPLANGDKVRLLIAQRTDIGYKAVVNDTYWGLLHNDDIRKAIRIGQRVEGYIKRLRDDHKLDLMLEPVGHIKADPLAKKILQKMEDNHGRLGLSDHSPAELIELQFGVSKRTFKMAIGKLYKERKIIIEDNGIRLATEADQQAAVNKSLTKYPKKAPGKNAIKPPEAQKSSAPKAQKSEKPVAKKPDRNKEDKHRDQADQKAAEKKSAPKVYRNPKTKTEKTLSLKKKT